MVTPDFVTGSHKAALIGGGFIGPVHAEALRRIGVEVIGLLGSSPARARPLAQRLGIDRVYDDLDSLLADDQVHSVHIASPNYAHFDQARRVIESGRHLVCEKPLAITSAETATLRELSRVRRLQAAAVNYNVRFYPLCHEMRERVTRGDIGNVLSVTGSYTQDWLLRPDDYNWRVEADGGTNLRAVADIGTHWMDLAQFVIGKPIKAVMADLATFHPTRFRPKGSAETFSRLDENTRETESVAITTEDHAAVLLRWEEGIRGVFHVSQVTAGRKNRLLLEVAGTEGAFIWDSESPETLWIGNRGKPNEILLRDPALLAFPAASISHYPGGHTEGFADTFKQLSLSVYHWIENGGTSDPGFPTFEDGHRELLLCEAIAKSHQGGAWVEL